MSQWGKSCYFSRLEESEGASLPNFPVFPCAAFAPKPCTGSHPTGMDAGPGMGEAWERESCVGREGIFPVPHQARGYPNLLLHVGEGCAAQCSQTGGLPQRSLVSCPELHPCIQPFPSLLPRGPWSLSQPLPAPKGLFLQVLKMLRVTDVPPQSLCGLGGLPGSSCSILVVMKSMGKSSP